MLCGWLSPDGNFYPCGPYEHVDLACQLTDQLYEHVEQVTDMTTNDDFLLKEQWIKLFCDGLIVGDTIHHLNYRKKWITNAQIGWIAGQQHKLSPKQERCLSMYLEFEDF